MTKPFMTLTEFNALAGSYAGQFAQAGIGEEQMPAWLIFRMNETYDLPVNTQPTLHNLGKDTFMTRMERFMTTLQKEVDEGQLIYLTMDLYQQVVDGARDNLDNLDALLPTLDVSKTEAAKWALSLRQ